MTETVRFRRNTRIRHAAGLAVSALLACLLAAADYNGVRVPLNAALSAAITPPAGIAVLAGSLFSYALTGVLTAEPVLICTLALTTLIRWVLGVRHSPRAAAALAGGSTLISVLIFGLAGLIAGREWLLWLGCSVLAAGLAYCIRCVMIRFENGIPVRLHAGDALAFSVCYVLLLAALCSVRIGAVSMGGMLAAFVVLTAARRYRGGGGMICGTLSACALILADSQTAGYAAVLPAAGFAAGALAGKRGAVQYAILQAFGGVALLLSGWHASVANMWMNGMLGGLAFLFLPASQLADVFVLWSDSDADLSALTQARMDFMSHAIAGVRGSAERIVNMLAKQEKPRDTADRVCENVCVHCRSRKICWERGDDTGNSFREMAAASFAEPLRAPLGCLKPDVVTEEFARMKRRDAIAKTLAARLRESQTLLFSQMKITEELLHRAAGQAKRTYHRELTRYVTDVLERLEVPFYAAAVSTAENGRMTVEIYLPAEEDEPEEEAVQETAELITENLQDALQKPLVFSGIETAGDEQRMIFQTEGGYTVTTAAAQCAVREDEPCGDCWDTFSDCEGNFYLAVSDGMGSGRRAAVDARIVLSDFRQLVQSGMDCKAAARLINAIMLTKSGDERFATLDVAKICTDTAAVTLYKYGAGPTFVKHGSRITLCQAATNPIGILPQAEPYTTVLKLDRGDMIFLLSDGLDDSLFPYIRQRLQQGGDLQTLAHTVCAKAQRDAKGAPRDDVTVLAAGIGG